MKQGMKSGIRNRMAGLAMVPALALGAGPLLAQQSGAPVAMQGGASRMDHAAMSGSGVAGMPGEPGQGAFAAIGEIVAALAADPTTDWSKVDIDTLRAHLVDMDMVVIWSDVVQEDTETGARFLVTGDEKVAGSIQRMVVGHAAVMQGVDGWSYSAEVVEGGAVLDVSVPRDDLIKLHALGFFGILTSGMHHQPHHWAMVTGRPMPMGKGQ